MSEVGGTTWRHCRTQTPRLTAIVVAKTCDGLSVDHRGAVFIYGVVVGSLLSRCVTSELNYFTLSIVRRLFQLQLHFLDVYIYLLRVDILLAESALTQRLHFHGM